MSNVAAGRLRHRVTIQRPGTTQDPITGEMVNTWADYLSLWAHVEPASVREFIAADAEQSEVRGKITLRYRNDLDATMRVLHRGAVYQILGVMADNQSGLEWITLAVSEGVRVT